MASRVLKEPVTVIGGGLAGAEAAWVLARFGWPVRLWEMKPKRFSPAHRSEGLGELVCSNSFGSGEILSGPGILKDELKHLGSIVMQAAELARVPAGQALSVDRSRFSEVITSRLESNPLIEIVREECEEIPAEGKTIVATGPLTSDVLAQDLAVRLGQGTLYFYDSISPIVTAESIDYDKAYFRSRYQEDNDDYLNCPLDEETYFRFVEEVRRAEKAPIRSFEALRCFEACLPIEKLVERGEKTLAFGPMKPVGLEHPKTGARPFAVVQLRRENLPTTLYNLVGFQTRMKWPEQKRVFRLIPGLEKAEFARYGSIHRNTYLDSPSLLNPDLSLKLDPRISVAGQLTGVEGYVESAAMGLWAGLAMIFGEKDQTIPPPETALGGLIRSITTRPPHGCFAPMNMNFGLFPPLTAEKLDKKRRREKMVVRAKAAAAEWRERAFSGLGRIEAEEETDIAEQPRQTNV